MAPKTDGTRIAGLVAELTAATGHQARQPIRTALRTACRDRSDLLARHLDHEDCFTRWEVVNLLGELGDPCVATRVVRFALDEDELHARWRSFWAVSRFDRSITVPILLDALRKGAEPDAWRAALILSMLGRSEAVPALVSGLASDDSWVQWEGLSALKALRSKEAVDAIIPFLSASRTDYLRREAALALGAIGGDDARKALEHALGDPDHEVRWRVASSLARIADRRSVSVLRRQLRTEEHKPTADKIQSDLARLEAAHGSP